MKRRLQVWYSGNVQGVGFRFQTKLLTTGYDVTGFVRNLPDGRVELVIEGEESELRAFQQAMRDSGLRPFIRDEQAFWTEAQNSFCGFEIMSR
jgi:acylphosphatase